MYDIKNPFEFLKELLEQRDYLLTFAGKVSSLLGPKDETRLNFSAWCEEHRIPEVKEDDLDDLIYQIYEEARKAYRAEDVMLTLNDRFKGQSFDADTIGAILTRFEKALNDSDEYYETYWNVLDEAIYDTIYLRCEDCDCLVDKNDCLFCEQMKCSIDKILVCPEGFELPSNGTRPDEKGFSLEEVEEILKEDDLDDGEDGE